MAFRLAFRPLSACLILSGLLLGAAGSYPSPTGSSNSVKETSEVDPGFAEAIARLHKLHEEGPKAQAEAEGKRLLALAKEGPGLDSPEAIEILHILANVLMDLGKKRLPEAVTIARQALQAAERIYPAGDLRLCSPLEDLAHTLEYFGAFEEANRFSERSLAIKEAELGPNDLSVAFSLGQVAVTYEDIGDYTRARLLYERALAIRDARGNAEDPYLGGLLYAITEMCRRDGEFEAARRYAERAVRSMEAVTSYERGFITVSLSILADVHRDLHEYAESVALYDRVIRRFGPGDPNVDSPLASQALSLSGLGKHTEAVTQARRGLSLHSKMVDQDDRTLVMYLRILATVLFNAGQAEEAEPLLERALRLHRQAYGPGHFGQARLLDRLSRIEYRLGKDDEALEHALMSEAIAREYFQGSALVLSERQAYRFESHRASSLGLALTVLSRGRLRATPDAAGRALDEVVRSRALVLDELTSRRRASMQGEGPEVAKLAHDLQMAKAQLAALVHRWPDPAGDSAAREIDDAAARKEQLERELARRSLEYRRRIERKDVGLASALAALPRRSALISYIVYDRLAESPRASDATMHADAGPHYAAFVLNTSSRIPSFFPLGSASEIGELVDRWSEAVRERPSGLRVRDPAEERYIRAGVALREKIWDPLKSAVEDAAIVLVVPDGALQLVNLGTLPSGHDRYLVEVGPLLHTLSAERDLVHHGRKRYDSNGALIMGGPDLDTWPAARRADSSPAGDAVSAAPGDSNSEESLSYRSSPPSCTEFLKMRFKPLPEARGEADEVKALLRGRPGVVELTGAAATEAAFKKMAPGRRLLHLATHGFFLQGRCDSALEEARKPGASSDWLSEAPGPVIGDNPLLLSGLALAGANRRDQIVAYGEDGILTAEEVGALDLSGVEWAVLSACETGIGRVMPGEGVLGLRRAFTVAGAGTLIMSLWPVEDQATREWMRNLYRRRLMGRSSAEAVREACVSMIEERRSKGRTTHPFFWGAFVAEGDWR